MLLDQVKEDSSRLEDKEYLDHINEEVSRKSTYIIVRKGDKLYYAGNEEAAQQIFEKLPAYGDENLSDDSGYFYNELEKYVKQIDFTFRDGTPGSVFIVTKVNSLISRHLLIDMFVAIIVILIFTSLMLTVISSAGNRCSRCRTWDCFYGESRRNLKITVMTITEL